MNAPRLAALSVLLILSPAGIPAAAAAWPTDPSVNLPVCTATNKQWRPEIAPDGAGGVVVTWHDYRSGIADIYVQKVDGDGSIAWAANGAAVCTQSASQWNPRVASDAAGGAIVAWEDGRGARSDGPARRDRSGGRRDRRVAGPPGERRSGRLRPADRGRWIPGNGDRSGGAVLVPRTGPLPERAEPLPALHRDRV